MVDTEPMVQAALSVLGAPYVWGATGPDEFDCSGLVQWSGARAGISLTRTTWTQILEGEPVVGAPQRGDLVFPDAGHVGIALGGNEMVHAPQPGDVVKIGPYWTEPIAIRRLGTNSGSVGSTAVDPRYQSRSGVSNLGNFIPTSDTVQAQIANLNTAVGQQVGLLSDIGGAFKAIGMFLTLLTTEEGWTRILKVAVGSVCIFIGIAFVAKEFIGRMM